MTQDNHDLENDDLDSIHAELENEQLANEQAEQEQAIRDAQAAAMAKELGIDEDDLKDFDPSDMPELTPAQEAAALEATKEMLTTPEGAEMAAIGALNFYEETLQEYGHEKFTLADKKKEIGAKRVAPVIQKYAPEVIGLFGQYKHEVLAAIFMGSLAYGSVKQIKALKAADLAEDKRLNPEKYAKAANDDTNEEAVA